MFDLNFIAEPGIHTENSDASWSFLHKRKPTGNRAVKKTSISKPKKFESNLKYFGWAACVLLMIAGYCYFFKSQPKVNPDMALNQVVDLIIESGYMEDLHLVEAHFMPRYVKVTITADELNSLQNFTRGYRKEDNIPYEIFQKNKMNYVSLNFPWKGDKKGGDIETLKLLAKKTVFSNKISINYTDNEFELHGRSSDIISYLLQMAENELIQKFTLSVYHLESGRFYLKVRAKQT